MRSVEFIKVTNGALYRLEWWFPPRSLEEGLGVSRVLTRADALRHRFVDDGLQPSGWRTLDADDQRYLEEVVLRESGDWSYAPVFWDLQSEAAPLPNVKLTSGSLLRPGRCLSLQLFRREGES